FWLIGLITAFMTSFYMFRLLFMTFFGEYHGDAHGHGAQAGEAPAPRGHGDGHAHGGIHESPWVMLGPLAVLAFLSVVGGWVGIHDRFGHFLAPVFESSAATPIVGEAGAAPIGENSLETTLMVVSVAAAVLGFLLAYLLYHRRPELPARIAASAH